MFFFQELIHHVCIVILLPYCSYIRQQEQEADGHQLVCSVTLQIETFVVELFIPLKV